MEEKGTTTVVHTRSGGGVSTRAYINEERSVKKRSKERVADGVGHKKGMRKA